MSISTTEITSTSIASDNPIHQRLLYAYVKACDFVSGDLLEIGCGEGRGIEWLLPNIQSYTAIDRNEHVIASLRQKFPQITLIQNSVPPFSGIENDKFDSLVTFQVIEHVEDDKLFMDEVHRVLKPGGMAIISTPNLRMSLTRNPWHVREYTKEELMKLAERKFSNITLMGVYGSTRMNEYHERNRESVKKFTRFDIFNLQYRLPRNLLKVPYDILNRVNRNKIQSGDNDLVTAITTDDFHLKPADDNCFDFFIILKK